MNPGWIDTLINDTGVSIGESFSDSTLEDYAAMTAVNLAGFFHITQRAIGQMVVQGNGHVVNVSTNLVDHADSARPAALASLTQGGLVAAARPLALEYGSRDVQVNAVALGMITTPMQDSTSYEGMAALDPLGRVGEISDVVDGILSLDRAIFVTAETVHIDGGQAAGR